MENSRRLKQMVIYSLLFILIMISCYSCSAKGMEKHDENMELKLVETYSLVSTNVLTNFQTNGTISGVYLFGSGTTSGNTGSKYLPIYQYWYKRGDGGIVSGIIDYSEFSFPEKVTVVIFEDDVYGELATEYPRPRTIHSWDIDGRVLLCSSFSKSIAPGLRVGWVAPGRYHDKLLHMKYATSSFNVPSTQMAAATFVLEGHYHRHIRRMRQNYQRNLALYTCWIREYFPCEICITRPKGGFLLWIELPEQVDMVCVARQLCRMNIQVAAGSIFSASGKYRNCLRINCALPLSETYREALKQIGEAVYRAME